MSRILTVADIHINDYANRNPENKFRLYQGSRTVANNIIKVGNQENCDIIVLAGDIVEKFLVRPYIQSEVKYFLDTIMSNFNYGFIIWGNHDLDNKSADRIADFLYCVLGLDDQDKENIKTAEKDYPFNVLEKMVVDSIETHEEGALPDDNKYLYESHNSSTNSTLLFLSLNNTCLNSSINF